MRFQLTDTFLTGIADIDDDHRGLVERINSIAEMEQRADTAALVNALAGFRVELHGHFQTEEACLRKWGYPERGNHAAHHAETIAALDRLINAVRDEEPIAERVAVVCYHELLSTILRKDMEFTNWLADHPDESR